MILSNEYLSDEALERLISEVEANELIPAPPELKENILHAILEELHTENALEKEESAEVVGEMLKPPQKRKKRKNRELAAYSFRVAMSAVAAVAFIFIVPYLPGFEQSGVELELTETIDEISPPVWRQEEDIRYQNYPTREEVLNETYFLKRVFGDDGIFEESNYLNIFMKEDGGQ